VRDVVQHPLRDEQHGDDAGAVDVTGVPLVHRASRATLWG
jgi:hypothetical protein